MSDATNKKAAPQKKKADAFASSSDEEEGTAKNNGGGKKRSISSGARGNEYDSDSSGDERREAEMRRARENAKRAKLVLGEAGFLDDSGARGNEYDSDSSGDESNGEANSEPEQPALVFKPWWFGGKTEDLSTLIAMNEVDENFGCLVYFDKEHQWSPIDTSLFTIHSWASHDGRQQSGDCIVTWRQRKRVECIWKRVNRDAWHASCGIVPSKLAACVKAGGLWFDHGANKPGEVKGNNVKEKHTSLRRLCSCAREA